MLNNKPKMSPLPTTEKLSPKGKTALKVYLKKIGKK
jgi:hypothetical protein